MKIILTQDINKLGKAGEIKEVSDGFARNKLIPQNLAVIATDEAVRALEFQKELKIKKTEKELEKMEEIAENLDGREIVIVSKAQEDGRLYGSITEKDIIESIKKNFGCLLLKKQIALEEHIKNIGEYNLTLNFDHGLEAEVKIIVEAENTQINENKNTD